MQALSREAGGAQKGRDMMDTVRQALGELRKRCLAWEAFGQRVAGLFAVDNNGGLRVLYARMNEWPEVKRLGDECGVIWGAGAPVAAPESSE